MFILAQAKAAEAHAAEKKELHVLLELPQADLISYKAEVGRLAAEVEGGRAQGAVAAGEVARLTRALAHETELQEGVAAAREGAEVKGEYGHESELRESASDLRKRLAEVERQQGRVENAESAPPLEQVGGEKVEGARHGQGVAAEEQRGVAPGGVGAEVRKLAADLEAERGRRQAGDEEVQRLGKLLADDAALRAPLREAGYEGERRQTRHQEAPQSAQCLSPAQEGRSRPPAHETAAGAKALKTVEGNQAGCSSSNHQRTQELIERHRGVLKRARAELTSQASELTRLTLQVSELKTLAAEREEERGMGDQEVATMGRSLSDVQERLAGAQQELVAVKKALEGKVVEANRLGEELERARRTRRGCW